MRVLIFISFFIAWGCHKDCDTFDHDPSLYYHCHIQKEWNKQSIIDSLLGSWLATKVFCALSTSCEFPKNIIDQNIMLMFEEDQLTLRFDDDSSRVGDWKIDSSSSSFKVDCLLDPYIFSGPIHFCENELFFAGSYEDGYDWVFIRTN